MPLEIKPLNNPTVSVIVCTYNGGQYIGPQLDSILAQTYPIHEIIIQDDQSNDGITPGIIADYAKRYPDLIHTYVTEDRKGINHNFLTAFSRATGDLIAWADQDDVWAPYKIERQVKQLGDNAICFHITHCFYGDAPRFETLTWDHRMPNFGLERTLFLGSVPGHTQIFRRDFFEWFCLQVPNEVIEKAGESFYLDAILSIVANAYHKIVCIVEPLDLHRRLSTSVSEVKRKDLSQRSLGNLVQQIVRCLNPEMRSVVRPLIKRRFNNMLMLLDCFPDAPYTADARQIAETYIKDKNIKFVKSLINNRNRIFFSTEASSLVGSLRAILFTITMYDYFALSYKNAKCGRVEYKK